MRSNIFLFIQIFIIVICSLFVSCKDTNKEQLSAPKIEAGVAKVSGRITYYHPKEDDVYPILTLMIPCPVTAEVIRYETQLNADGSFFFEAPIECNTIGCIVSESFFPVYVCLVSNEETKLDITDDGKGNKIVNMISSLGLTSNDMLNLGSILEKMLKDRTPDSLRRYITIPNDFAQNTMNGLERKLKIATSDSVLSKGAKEYVSNEFKLLTLVERLLNYDVMVHIDYLNSELEERPDSFIAPPSPNRSYYSFLKYFNLNDPHYLYNSTYSQVLQAILLNDTLNIPAINDTPINTWLKEVKNTMADLIGSDTGLFYEMLAANAYAQQFNEKVKPLSEQQKENICNYFNNKEITKILFAKNDAIIKLYEERLSLKTVINETPPVPKEDLMNAIISKYKGKVVLVDFWATWCGPCLEAIKLSKKIKSDMKDKEIVFIYITGSSPQKEWEKKIHQIDGEHYFITEDEWSFIMNHFDFSAIPTYLFYNANGELKNKITGYPGTEKMQQMIEELLP